MAALARAYSTRILFVPQPFLGTKRVRSPTEAAMLPPADFDQSVAYYRRITAAAQRTAREADVPFIDLLDVFDDRADTIYADAVHVVVERGNPAIARRIAQAVLEQAVR
jgi:hypothetical protein